MGEGEGSNDSAGEEAPSPSATHVDDPDDDEDEKSEGIEEDDRVSEETETEENDSFTTWTASFERLLQNLGKKVLRGVGRKMKIFSLCSGLDGATLGARSVIGPENVRHVVSADSAACSREFILANFDPEHLYGDINSFLDEDGLNLPPHCFICDKPCSAVNEIECDLLLAGFPCPPYSTLNSKRWGPDHKPFNTKDGSVFIAISRWLRSLDVPPKMVILENVPGLAFKDKTTGRRPLDFLMDGRLRGGEQIGLNFLSDYLPMQVFDFAAEHCGLPMRRSRLFLVLVRKDIGTEAMIDAAKASARHLQSHQLPQVDLDFFWCEMDMPESRMKTPAHQFPRRALEASTAIRSKYKLADIFTANGSPASSAPDAYGITKLPRREQDVLDVALLCCEAWEAKGSGWVLEDLVADLSQQADREPWWRSRVGSLHGRSKIWFRGKLMSIGTMFTIVGWPTYDPDVVLKIPDVISRPQMIQMLGNICTPPQLGAILMCLLCEIDIGSDSEMSIDDRARRALS